MEKPFLYCPHCKKYPNKIKEIIQNKESILRNWNSQEYEKVGSSSKSSIKAFCPHCGTELRIKGQIK